ncbi:MAG: choice-of-anchor tandem repeat NxxGxxAF-containing protein [Planctomycetota bacterium]
MRNCWLVFATLANLVFLSRATEGAETTTLAVTGAAAPGLQWALFDQLNSITLNNAGATAFSGSLTHGGAIDAANDSGIWLFTDNAEHLIAQTGEGNVPGIAGADFAEFDRPLLSASGDLLATARLASGIGGVSTDDDEGLWRFDTSSGSLELRAGSGNVPGVSTADFARAPSFFGTTNVAVASNGDFGFFNDMQFGIGGVLSTNNRGVWSYATSGSELLAREGVSLVPGVGNARFATFTTPRVNANGQLAVRAVVLPNGSINAQNADGVWQYTGTAGALIARTGVGNVPGYASRSFATLGWPRMNEVGQVAIGAALDDVSSSQGVWLFDNGVGALVASPDTEVPGIDAGVFAELQLDAINDSGQILASASLAVGNGGVIDDDRHGLWLLGTDGQLVARTGSSGVPGIGSASFAAFGNAALNERGQVAFAADLQVGGEIDQTNDGGIWIIDPAGPSWLVAREGDQLAGRTVESLSFLTDEDEDRGAGFNDIGELAFRASFTNGDSGLFLFRPHAADFDRDGGVDGDDLDAWKGSYATSAEADADHDDDSDGSDFLVWQRELPTSSSAQPIVSQVPEPTSLAPLAFCALGGLVSRLRNRQ